MVAEAITAVRFKAERHNLPKGHALAVEIGRGFYDGAFGRIYEVTPDEEPGAVKLTLFRAPEPGAGPEITSRQAAFLARVKPGRELKVATYARAAGISERQARRDLGDLEEAGLTTRTPGAVRGRAVAGVEGLVLRSRRGAVLAAGWRSASTPGAGPYRTSPVPPSVHAPSRDDDEESGYRRGDADSQSGYDHSHNG